MNRTSKRMIRILALALLMLAGGLLILPHRTGFLQEPESPSAVFTVTNNLNAGTGSFRQAIIDANATTALDTIQFAVGTGPAEISLSSALPDITQPVIIDGTTQPGFSGTPLITLSGNFSGSVRITAGGSTVKAITLTRFSNGLVLENAGGNIITGNYIGACPPPNLGCANSNNGIRIINSPNNRIGGSTPTERNIISGNQDKGIEVTGSASSGNIVTGNYVGHLADGSPAGNGNFGVAIIGAPNNRVGGTLAGERNVITGNAQLCNLPPLASNSNVFISGAGASGNTVQGNYIGTAVDGMSGADTCAGVRIENAPNNTIGGTAGTTPGGACTGACNLISGYAALGNESGVMITGSGATGNSLLGNFIGTNAAGTARINNDVGITITASASNNTIGGTTAAGRNLIANGLWLSAGAATNTVQGNYIGTDTSGNIGIGFISGGQVTAALTVEDSPNNRIGIATGTTLGGACTGGCNLISGNNLDGVRITGAGSTGNRVDYNYIGLNAAGTAALRNLGGAIRLLNGASNNIIGRPVTAMPFHETETVENVPEATRVVQDDISGDWIQFDDVTGDFTAFHCASGTSQSGRAEVRLNSAGTTIFRPGLSAGISTNGQGFGNFIFPGPAGFRMTLLDSNTTNSTTACPMGGKQNILGTITNGVSSDPNPPNNNTYNSNSVGCSANEINNLSSETADGNFVNSAGNSNDYTTNYVCTRGEKEAVVVRAGTDNYIAGLTVQRIRSAITGGAIFFREIDLHDDDTTNPPVPNPGPGANRSQNAPVNIRFSYEAPLFTVLKVTATLNMCVPNSRFLVVINATRVIRSQLFATTDSGVLESREVTTDANGNAEVNFLIDVNRIGEADVTATATAINAVQIVSENSAPSFVDVPGDTSEMSLPAAVPQPQFDFDSDGKTDIAVYRPGAEQNDLSYWYILKSADSTFQVAQFGVGEDLPVAGDYQGDDISDFAVFRPSTATWYHSRINGNPSTNFESIRWGLAMDIPVPGDYDHDGANDAAVFRPSDRTWYVRRSLDASLIAQTFGLPTDKLVPADYDGDGDTDIAVYRNGTWYISPCPGCPPRYEQFGLSGDVPTPGDYDGDGRDDVAVYRPSTGIWYMQRSTAGFSAVQFGLAADKPVNGDFDADGKNDIAVFRPSDGTFYILRSEQGFIAVRWGLSTDIPIGMFPN